MTIDDYFSNLECGLRQNVRIGSPEQSPNCLASDEFNRLVRCRLYFWDESYLDLNEVVNTEQGDPVKIHYAYTYIRGGQRILRYDNAPHHPELPTHPHHKHIGPAETLAPASEPSLPQILAEVESLLTSQAHPLHPSIHNQEEEIMQNHNMDDMQGMQGMEGMDHGEETFGVHGMLLVGRETIYLSHLPMFMAPHNFQVILQVSLDDNAMASLHNFRAHFGADEMYTVQPEEFHITELAPNEADKPARTEFKANLFRGHFERGGRRITEDTTVHVDEVVYFQQFSGATDKPSELEYLLFGKGDEYFLAHWITQPPDFDQVLSVKVSGHDFPDEEILRGVHVSFDGRKNTPHERIKPGEKLTGRGHVTGAHQFLELEIEALAEIYFEEGELAKRATFKPTKEEKAAGFGS